jgi:hypothetical protein
MPLGLSPFLKTPWESFGIVAFLSFKSDQLPVSSSTTCIPPPLEVERLPPGRDMRSGAGLGLWFSGRRRWLPDSPGEACGTAWPGGTA